ncbi:MAG: FG-GAP repeat domain-containing protein [Nitrososphaeraceae archaeon]
MVKSTLLTIMLIGTLIPGMILSVPSISFSGSHFLSSNENNKIIQAATAATINSAFAQEDDSSRIMQASPSGTIESTHYHEIAKLPIPLPMVQTGGVSPGLTTTCTDTDPLPTSLGLNGSDITVIDENICQTTGVVECPNGSSLADAEDFAAGKDVRTFVTAESLCDFPQDLSFIFLCEESGFLVTNQTDCPQKCEDGTYLMQGMECPALLTVFKNFNGCVIDNNGTTIDCPPGIPSEPANFTINVEGNNVKPSSSFVGDDNGTLLTIGAGAFEVTEEQVSSTTVPPQCNEILGETFDAGADLGSGQYICTNFNDSCSGNINLEDELTCIVDNTIAIDIFVDVVTANLNSNQISLFLGDGTGNFSTSTEFDVGGDNSPLPQSIAVGFFNDDSNLDVVTANFNSNQISIFLGDGNGNFITSTEFDVAISGYLGYGYDDYGTSTEYDVGGENNPGPFAVAVGNFN